MAHAAALLVISVDWMTSGSSQMLSRLSYPSISGCSGCPSCAVLRHQSGIRLALAMPATSIHQLRSQRGSLAHGPQATITFSAPRIIARRWSPP